MSDELLDLVDANDEPIGTVLKSIAHQNPKLFHREIAVAIFNDISEVLLQQRSFDKNIHPGLWTISAAGHIAAGENPEHAAIREVSEELGIGIEPIFFKKIFKVRSGQESRFIWIYYALINKKQIPTLDSAEVAKCQWVKVYNLEKFSRTHQFPKNSSSLEIIYQIAEAIKLK